MPNIIQPKCLSRRYEALDQLIEELALSTGVTVEDFHENGVTLMRQFWDIVKDNTEDTVEKSTNILKTSFSDVCESCNLADSSEKCFYRVNQSMRNQDCQEPLEPLGDMDLPCAAPLSMSSVALMNNDHYIMNRASCKGSPRNSGTHRTVERKSCVKKAAEKKSCDKIKFRRSNERRSSLAKNSCSPIGRPKKSFVYASDVPIRDALGKLKTVDSMAQKCNQKIDEMMNTTNFLENRMRELEEKEKTGILRMQEADRMWSAMENCYKKKLQDTYKRQEDLIKEIEIAESRVVKSRKSCQEKEQEIKKIEKLEKETIALRQQKNTDIQCMRVEIENIEKNIENYSKSMIDSTTALKDKKLHLAEKIKKHTEEALKLENELVAEQKNKKYIEIDGNRNLKETRRNLSKLSNMQFSKKIESKELSYQSESVSKDIELLRDLKNQCKDRCMNRDKYIKDEIELLKTKIAAFSVRCVQCHQSIDTDDVKKYCSDCPRCQEGRCCVVEDGFCRTEPKNDCVCMSVKQRFLDNIFDNMYSVLEINSQSKTSQEVADRILHSLQMSRNGKLDEETRKYIQNFILKTVKRNLNGILIGGAVKTRCEMDQETYKQLMLCLTKVTVNRTETKEIAVPIIQPCSRWQGSGGCQCVKDKSGACRCSKLAPLAPEPYLPAIKPKEVVNICQSTSKNVIKDTRATQSCSTKKKKSVNNSCKRKPRNQCVHRHEVVSRPDSMMSVDNEMAINKSGNSNTKIDDDGRSNRDNFIAEVFGRYGKFGPAHAVT